MNQPERKRLWKGSNMERHDAINSLLAATARWTASVRALGTQRPDSLLNDPWAGALAGEEGANWIVQRSPDKVLPIVIRTRYFDDFLHF